MHEPLQVLPLCLCQQQRIQDQALVVIADVIYAPSRPGDVQRQLDQASSRPLRSSREDGTRRSYPAQRDGKAPSSIRPIILP